MLLLLLLSQIKRYKFIFPKHPDAMRAKCAHCPCPHSYPALRSAHPAPRFSPAHAYVHPPPPAAPSHPRGSISLLGIQFENVLSLSLSLSFSVTASYIFFMNRDCVNDEPAQPYGSSNSSPFVSIASSFTFFSSCCTGA